jgi:hypothetical protein
MSHLREIFLRSLCDELQKEKAIFYATTFA